jgi:membrane protease YdiL (CAAX protease family)
MGETEQFRIKDGIMLCFFLMGVRFAVDLPFMLLGVRLDLVYDLVFLGIVILIVRRYNRDLLRAMLSFKPVSLPLFCGLLVMFLGFDIILAEIGNILQLILPVPDGFFGSGSFGNFLPALITYAVFPAFTEEIFFRGMLLRRLRKNYSSAKAVGISALFFGLMHLNPWQALHAFLAGLFLGWIYLTFKTLWLCMFMHFYNNLLASFVPFPAKLLPNPRGYDLRIIHPLWFDGLGIILFGIGLVVVLGLRNTGARGGKSFQARTP